jgi:hypothetical protein
VFPRKAKLNELSFLFKVFILFVLLAIINPEVWVVLLGGILYLVLKIFSEN